MQTGDLERVKFRFTGRSIEAVLDRLMDTIANEAVRVAEVAHNSREIIDNLDEEFERQ